MYSGAQTDNSTIYMPKRCWEDLTNQSIRVAEKAQNL